MQEAPVKVGVVGCGAISNAYFKANQTYAAIDIVACSDLDAERARAKAAEQGIRALTTEELLADPEIEIVLNLTIPNAHYSVCKAALQSGKHTHVEKPLAVKLEEGADLVASARAKGLRLGGAPDTFLGGGIQTCRKLLDEGAIGTPVAAEAQMLSRGHETWHPSPEFYYKAGGGPMFDMGPYYLTALAFLLGPIARVTGSTRITFPTRTITSQPLKGTVLTVDVPTHIAGVMEFASGAIGTLTTSFDVYGTPHFSPIVIYGTEGTLAVPDPNGFGGPVKLLRPGGDWEEIALTHGVNHRGIGIADIGRAIRTGRPHRANGDLAFHVLEAMHGFHRAAEAGAHYAMTSTLTRPAPLPPGLAEGKLD